MVVFVLFLTVLIGFAALAIDTGSWFLEKRRAQAAAAAGALAAASALPTSNQAALDAATAAADDNMGDSVLVSGGGHAAPEVQTTVEINHGAPSRVTVSVSTHAGAVFARLFGIERVDVAAHATAEVGSYRAWAWNLAPWAIDQPSLPPYGTHVDVKYPPGSQVAPGNFGAVDLPIDTSAACPEPPGANVYRDVIARRLDTCGVTIGQTLPTETGNMSGPTAQGLTARGAQQGYDWHRAVTSTGTGSYAINDESNPNVIVIPIIDAWSNGKSTVKVLGFATFVITGWSSSGGGKNANTSIQGVFIRTSLSPHDCPGQPGGACPLGGYDPNGFTGIRLVS